ncbi:hypothetical protein Vadar_014649 [Vaccinium darrowii]|uniref:Uncharacterized protein n=1 Tax=Vaccinium darrowii TaxID=229202 RepID=A0ACB7X155_9ERIC|nr:hypothetical protein Vadar_014649 [Vaccinium darrowii]
MLQKLEEQSGFRNELLLSLEKDKRKASTSKHKSRPGKEPINVGDIPESWYEPTKTYDPKHRKSYKQTTNISFEPNIDGLDGRMGFKNDDYGFDEYNFTPRSHFPNRVSLRKPYPDTGIPKYLGVPEMGTTFEWYSNLPPKSVPNWQKMEELFHAQFYQTEPEVTMADLARLKQKPDEKAAQFIARFKRARNKCKLQLPEVEFVRIAQDGLSRELRKKFDCTEFKDLVDLTYKASRYESLLEEDVDRNNSSYSTYYRDPTYEIDVAEIVEHDPCVCESLVQKDSSIAPRTNKKQLVKANYLIFKDLDKQGVDFFPKRMERKALDQNNERKPWVSPNQGRNEKPWLVSKRNVLSSPVPPTSKREYPPSKKVNIEKAPMNQGNEVQKEQFTLVKGVPDWFLKKIKPELFQGCKAPAKIGNKMFKPPNTTIGQWVVIRDPKTKTPQMVPMLTRTQKRKL